MAVLRVKVQGATSIYIKDHGSLNMKKDHGDIILLDQVDDEWVLYVFADINREDPTHRIELGGARESRRQE